MRKAASTISLGFGIFIVAWILLLVIGFGVPYHTSYNVALQIVFSLFPWSLLAKGLQDLATAATGKGLMTSILILSVLRAWPELSPGKGSR